MANEVTIVVYEGWDDEEATRPVREAGLVVDAIYVDNDSDLLDAMREGAGRIDLVCIDNRFARVGIEEGTILPLDFERLPNTREYMPKFAEIATSLFDGTWSAPYVWGTCPLAYNALEVSLPPASVLGFSAPDYVDRVVIRDEPYNQIVVFARALGFEDPLQLSRAELDRVIEAILDLKRQTNAPVLPLNPLYDLLVSGEKWLSTSAGWEGVTRVTAARGADVRSYHSEDGDHGWFDSWCLLRDAPNPDGAYAWIDCTISAEAQRIVCDKLPCGPVNRHAAEAVGAEVSTLFPSDEVERIFGRPADIDVPPLHPDGDRATLGDWRAGWERVRAA